MKETQAEIRARLWRDENVQKAIELRAYEIWILRGRQDGRHHEDWFLAENEVLNYLVEEELKRLAEAADITVEEAREIVEEIVAAVEEEQAIEPVVIEEYVIVAGDPIEEANVAPADIIKEKQSRKRAATEGTTAKPAARKKATGDAGRAGEKRTASKKSAAKRTTTKKAAGKKGAKADQPAAE